MEKASLGSEQCHKVGGTLPLHKSPPVISTTGVWGRASRHAAAPAASDSLPFLPFLAPVSSVPDVQFKPICVEKLLRYFPTFEQFPFHQKSSTVASSFPGQVLLPLNPPAQAQPEGFDRSETRQPGSQRDRATVREQGGMMICTCERSREMNQG